MRVLLLFQHLRTEDERGGQRSREIAEFLSKKGKKVTALIPNVDPLTEKKAIANLKLPWKLYKNQNGYSEYRYYTPGTPRQGIIGRIFYSMFCMINASLFMLFNPRSFDAIYTTTHPLPMSLAALPAKWINRTKLIIEIRDIPLDVAIERKIISKSSFFARTYIFLERALLSNASHVISYSSRMIDILSARSEIFGNRIIPIGVDESIDIKKEKTGFKLPVKFVFFGTLGKVLSLEIVLDLLIILEKRGLDTQFDVYGSGDALDNLKKYAHLHGLNVRFMGVIAKKDVVKTCSRYDFAVYPVQGGGLYLLL